MIKNKNAKFLIVVGAVVALLVVIGFKNKRAALIAADDEPAVIYKTKCAVCHTAQAEKHFDLSKPDEQHVETILKGKKDAKPPMPAYGTKGMTPETAKALVTYMRGLRPPVNANANADLNTNANTNINSNANANANINSNATTNSNANLTANVNRPVNANQ